MAKLIQKQRFHRKRGIILPEEELGLFSGSQVASRRVLVINSGYQPITTTTVKRAVNKLFKELAVIILPPNDECSVWQELDWSDWAKLEPRSGESALQAAKRAFRVPEIIKTLEYNGLPKGRVKVSRRAIFRRDMFTCQYCGKSAPKDLGVDSLNLDHLVPRSQGGKTTFENVVLSCVDCNRKKGDKPLETCGLKLKKKPTIPAHDILQGRTIRLDSWKHFLTDVYFEVPLKD